MDPLLKYLRIWLKLTFIASQIAFISRFGALTFVVAKILRFAFFGLFLVLIASKTKVIAGYSLWQVILFFATFNLIDVLAQFFLREAYRFRQYVVSGYFDFLLIKPFSSLFRSLFGGSDILDLPMILLSVLLIFISASKLSVITMDGIFVYLILILNAFIIAVSFHILVLVIGVLTTEVDNTIMLYRDLTQMGRVPVDIYREPVSFVLTFIFPIGIMMTFPAKALMGLLSINTVLLSLLTGFLLLFLSIKLWRISLKHYSSASS